MFLAYKWITKLTKYHSSLIIVMQLGSCMKTADYQVLFLAVRVGVRFILFGYKN